MSSDEADGGEASANASGFAKPVCEAEASVSDSTEAVCEACEVDADGCTCCDEGALPVQSAPLAFAKPKRSSVVSLRGRMKTLAVQPKRPARLPLSSFPLVDAHQHAQADDDEGLANLHRVNTELGIRHAVLLALRQPGSDRRDVQRRNRWVLAAARRYRGAFIPFVTVVEDDPGAATMLAAAIDEGARGLKLIGWAGAFVKAFDYDLRSEAMSAVFRVAESRGVRVIA